MIPMSIIIVAIVGLLIFGAATVLLFLSKNSSDITNELARRRMQD